jgi:predicted MPP superfamily phosphohydrolase
MRRFRIIVLFLFAAIAVYLVLSLGLTLIPAILLFCAFAVILWMPLVFWQSEDEEDTTPVELVMQRLAFSFMGFLSFLWITTLLRDFISLLISFPLHSPRVTLWIVVISFIVFVSGALNAFFRLKTVEVKVPMDRLPKGLQGLRIVQISDVHVGPSIRLKMVERIVSGIERARPDIIVLTGDAVDGTVAELSPLLEPFKYLRAPLGKYYILGNHEYYWGADAWVAKFRELGFHPLLNSHEVITYGGAKFLIAGITDPAASQMGGVVPNLDEAFRGAPSDCYPRILLAHQPGIAPLAAEKEIELQLSGHTHGGQFFPWTIVASYIHQFPYGLRKIRKLWVYVSRGTGFWGPPVRLGAPAEISVLILSSSK